MPTAFFSRAHSVARTALLLSFCAFLSGCNSTRTTPPIEARRRTAPLPMPTPVKAVWVARFHYHYPEDIRTILRTCAADGFNTVIWQVRGSGTVAYPSHIEPWSREYDHRDPGFDPLAIAVEAAHKNGLRIEAWVNVMPGWRGPKPPRIEEQLWKTRPEWFLHDASAKRQPLGDFYAILNPCLPEVRTYITSIVDEIVSNYDVDGVHLDYVRYAWETTPNASKLYPRDPETLRLYREQTGKAPDDNAKLWDRWRADQITRLVTDIRQRIDQRRPGATLTAAIWSSPTRGYDSYLQNSIAWLRKGLIHAGMPMAYTESLGKLREYIGEYHANAPQARIIPGLGVYKHETPEQMSDQLRQCADWGGDYAIFSYGSLHAAADDRGNDGNSKASAEQRRLRKMRKDLVRNSAGS